jgi:hypothetical protein
MILDKGYCSIYEVTNTAQPGDMPVEGLKLKYQSWYGELNFESSPSLVGGHEGVAVANRIRIPQNRDIDNHHVAVLSTVLPPDGAPKYNVVRAYHGVDDDNGELITDLSLERLGTEIPVILDDPEEGDNDAES